jgi:hypothetical protein
VGEGADFFPDRRKEKGADFFMKSACSEYGAPETMKLGTGSRSFPLRDSNTSIRLFSKSRPHKGVQAMLR